MKSSKNLSEIPEKGLSSDTKTKIFFFGVFAIILAGPQYFYNQTGTKRQKRENIIYYVAGVIFWVILLVSLAWIASIIADEI